MANKPKRPAENYLKMPNHIRNIPELGRARPENYPKSDCKAGETGQRF